MLKVILFLETINVLYFYIPKNYINKHNDNNNNNNNNNKVLIYY
jgi:hypothetical protein